MSKSGRSVFRKVFKNRSDLPITLKITLYENRAVRILIDNSAEQNLQRTCVLIVAVVMLNVLALALQLLSVTWCLIVFAAVLLFIYNMLYTVKRESLFIVKSLGYQLEVHYAAFHTVRYIPCDHIKYIFINEVISKQKVIFILSMCTENTANTDQHLIPLFVETMPRLDCLKLIYQSIEALQ